MLTSRSHGQGGQQEIVFPPALVYIVREIPEVRHNSTFIDPNIAYWIKSAKLLPYNSTHCTSAQQRCVQSGYI